MYSLRAKFRHLEDTIQMVIAGTYMKGLLLLKLVTLELKKLSGIISLYKLNGCATY